ncbi:MAG: DUF2207 domain-containing protein [Prevotella sp.]|nr:DUF2207 domain-containing protein [Prevotella sp.]
MNRTKATYLALLTAACATADDGKGMYLTFLPEWVEDIMLLFGIIVVPVALIVLFVGMYKKVFRTIWYVISLQPLRRKRLRERLTQGMEYYRDIPARGNLKVASVVMNSLSSKWLTDYSGLFGALILRLVDCDALKMENKATMYGTEPHPVLSIGQWPGTEKRVANGIDAQEAEFEGQFHQLMSDAAGSDGVLQPRELQRHLRRHRPDAFIESLKTLTDEEKVVAGDAATAKQLLALRKFLLDFSLIRERGTNELVLWKEYLVYATLFGIADKVCKNFEDTYPDYFRMNALAGTRLDIVGNNALVTYVDAAVKGIEHSEQEKK